MNKELKVAFEVLRKVYSKNAFSSIELNRALNNNDISNAMVTKIVYGVIENDILLDYYLKQFLQKKPKLVVLIILKIGVYVNKFLNSIPDFALVNELVNLSKTIDKSLSGFVNAVLKNIIKTEITLPNKSDKKLYLSVKYSYPLWLVTMLVNTYGYEFAEEFMAHKLPTLTHVRVNLGIISTSSFEDKLKEFEIGYEKSVLDNAFYVEYEKLLKTKELEKTYIVMGVTSMNLCEVILPIGKKRVLDTCGSPGGKSLYLSQLNDELRITTCDILPHRVELIKSLIANYEANNINAKISDATVTNHEFVDKFDLVLCDVPCSGIGVAGKKPDILLNRTPESIIELVNIQKDIIKTSADYVKVGGELVYSTCTILKEENQDIVNDFLNKNKNYEIVKINENPNLKSVNDNNMLSYFPNVSNAEGFFIAKLKRIS